VTSENSLESQVLRQYIVEKITGTYTNFLKRNVDVEIFLPHDYLISGKKYPLLILNDGQDNEAVRVKATVERLSGENLIPEIIVAGITAGDRLQEYGMAGKTDHKGRGKLSKNYSQYLLTELLPYLIYKYPLSSAAEDHAIAGYSLGGLSALDIGWNNPSVFSKIGVFSGSLWWRRRDTSSRFYSDYRDRMMHLQVRAGKYKKGLKFWFETGTEDETNDRNKNGVIDSIDDTLDLISELTRKGYRPFHDISYVEIKNGKHNPETWAVAMPVFLVWAFGEK
jgi:enterochelin esterase-like enzyme